MTDSRNFFHKLEFRDGKLSLSFGSGGRADGSIAFDYVRAFLFFKESDFFRELGKHQTQEIELEGAYPYVKLFKLLRHPILEPVLGNRLAEENASYFLFWTPDECFEVVAFDDPKVNPIASEERGK